MFSQSQNKSVSILFDLQLHTWCSMSAFLWQHTLTPGTHCTPELTCALLNLSFLVQVQILKAWADAKCLRNKRLPVFTTTLTVPAKLDHEYGIFIRAVLKYRIRFLIGCLKFLYFAFQNWKACICLNVMPKFIYNIHTETRSNVVIYDHFHL